MSYKESSLVRKKKKNQPLGIEVIGGRPQVLILFHSLFQASKKVVLAFSILAASIPRSSWRQRQQEQQDKDMIVDSDLADSCASDTNRLRIFTALFF